MTFPDGHEGWMATSHRHVREVLADPRFSVRGDLTHSPYTARPQAPAPKGFFARSDPPEHTRYRKLLTGQFTVHRMRALEARIAEIVDDHLDAMTKPADLVRDFALPIPSLVICELLGVPYADRARFQEASARLLDLTAPPGVSEAAMLDLSGYLGGLVAGKQRNPEDDLLSGLTREDLTVEEITSMALLLLVAGHETTANMLGYGTFVLLQNPDQIEHVLNRPDQAVEELLRHLSILPMLVRAATEDVEIDGVVIREGQSVALGLPEANYDPERFSQDLDFTRNAQGHLTFGHGVHQCLGQQLARVEMRIAFPALFRRFPTLALAVPPEEVPMRTSAVHGVARLPVTW